LRANWTANCCWNQIRNWFLIWTKETIELHLRFGWSTTTCHYHHSRTCKCIDWGSWSSSDIPMAVSSRSVIGHRQFLRANGNYLYIWWWAWEFWIWIEDQSSVKRWESFFLSSWLCWFRYRTCLINFTWI
jgi:hypothetical protein